MVHQARAKRERPLADVTVLDLSDEATVFGARLLAEQGADVVRVEHAQGDPIRKREPFLKDEPGTERSLAHLLYNAGKRSCALDLLMRPLRWTFPDMRSAGRAWVRTRRIPGTRSRLS